MLEVERADTTALQQELRSARQELDKLEREKRLAAPPPPVPTPAAAASRPTMSVRTANYYNPSATSTPSQTPTTATFMPPYRPYSYSYSQYPTTQYTYNPHAYGATHYGSAASYGAATTTPTTRAYSPPTSASTMTPTSSASAQVQQAQAHPASASNTAVPVQLPVTSLNALSALGIVPIAAASVPSAGPQPPAVIKSTNGSTLNLEINLSLLQSAQMSGLALILNALTSRGVNVDGSTTGSGVSTTSTAAPSHPSQPVSYANGGVGTVAAAGTTTAAAAAGTTASASNAASSTSGKPYSVPPAAIQPATLNAASPPSAAPSGPASSASTSPSPSASAGTPQT